MTAAVTVVVMAFTGGCSVGGESDGPDGGDAGTTGDATPSEPETTATPPPRPDGVPVAESEACSEVRAGIDAFNAGAFDETVTHFEAALPLAQEQDDGSAPASQLIEAVRYYAELDAELYPEAARTSPEFAKYKTITLGQCVAGDGATSEPPGANI